MAWPMEIVCCFNRMGVALLILLFIYGLIDAQVLKYPGDECSVGKWWWFKNLTEACIIIMRV